ncbi:MULTISPECIES: Txe/YoeB family addiction module toxin [unclassified Cyanobium]|uniref:Txe/YoeB family addiction module toxin n=1 Tax=unclassified Cyanobium TaxID=2627006 RepID=UPI0020CC5DE2|nr:MULTISPECIES: Txe/YoeB family addiction module toxin [unclassified Cyanobium]MCP9834200.1 Txe/YoeB family addiction module toxin [Cyanobium sp. La Preciosa 7G6]MCP9936963.1 Txe/YoeB family addiction module toxin [Cyanobium sp. Aljojuca 7A6]
MRLIFAEQAWQDYLHWQATDKALLKRINALIREASRTPFSGTGKPEALKHALAGYWSRRINDEHRMVYRVDADALLLAQLRYHY